VCVTSPALLFRAGQARRGLTGDLPDVYRYHGIDAAAIVRACLNLAD